MQASAGTPAATHSTALSWNAIITEQKPTMETINHARNEVLGYSVWRG